ncbi:uncharacterized protein LOC117152872 [Anabas testudineus]|uniref:Ig-like domain-containing protein n=1 Tax=Anabas testudineus TaxID=64144 RepID=A0A3Q1JIJ8_ANATE|nr:uncharacterized protein LOC117152872 [Anabas testudineus]XP_033181939.1 uncharacterized protein LOC117152872 [Anabas testudineus]
MFQTILFIQLLLVHYTIQGKVRYEVDCNKNVSLTCPDVDFDNLNFLSVTWYKLEKQKKHGIVRKGKSDTSTQNYNFTRVATFGEKYSLFIPNVTPEDSGNYECAISANVGGQNLNLGVDLTVYDCVTQAETTSVITVFNTTESTLLCQNQAEDLPVLWGIIGYVAVGLTKILICLMSIWALHMRSSRQQRVSELEWS